MREVVLRVPRFAVEDVLDRLLPVVPGGVREVPAGRQVELRMRGEQVPTLATLRRAAGRWSTGLIEREAADDWRERRLADYEEHVIGGRLVVRPAWAPPPSPRMIDIVLGESAAFGGGTHPTTRTCLELLLEVELAGPFADLGCGTGVLALLAAKLGWAPVLAWDAHPASVEATRANAALNRAAIEVELADLWERDLPAVAGFAANLPAVLHGAVAGGWGGRAPRVGVLSGFGPEEAPGVLEGYAAIGLHERRRVDSGGWTVVVIQA